MNRRLLSRLRATFPLSFVIPWLVLGQVLENFVSARLGLAAVLLCAVALSIVALASRWLCVFSLLLGVVSAVRQPAPPTPLSGDRTYVATISGAPERPRVGALRLHVAIVAERSAKGELSLFPGPVHALCRAVDLPWRNASTLQAGDTVLLKGNFRPVLKAENPFSYDAMLTRHGFSHTCKIRYASAAVVHSPEVLSRIRSYTRRFVFSKLGDGEAAGLVLSMSVGARNLLSDETEHAFKQTGLAHLLIASGYQVMVVFFAVTWVTRFLLSYATRLQRSVHLRTFSSALGFGGSVCFVMLVGFEASILRALFAALFLVIGSIQERGGQSFNGVLFAFFGLTLCWPCCYLEPGVQLTFAALCGLSLSGARQGGFLRYLTGCVLACVATSAVSLAWFGTLSLWTFVLNPVLAPLGSLIGCAGGLLGIFLCWVGLDPLGTLLQLVAHVLELFRDLVLWLAQVPCSNFLLEGWARATLSVVLAGLFAAIVWRQLRRFELEYSLR